MAVSIPHSFSRMARHEWFGIAYMAVQLLVLAMQGTEAMRDAATRKAFIDFGSFASIAPLFVVAGGFAHDGGKGDAVDHRRAGQRGRRDCAVRRVSG